MFPVFAYMYLCLARREAREMTDEFGDAYRRYAAAIPAFFPRLRQQKPGNQAIG